MTVFHTKNHENLIYQPLQQLGQVEAALAEINGVSAAVVIAHGAEGQDKQLIGYVVPSDWENVPSANTIRQGCCCFLVRVKV